VNKKDCCANEMQFLWLLQQVFFKENVRYPVCICSDSENVHYYHFVILIAVSAQIFPLIIFSDSRGPDFQF